MAINPNIYKRFEKIEKIVPFAEQSGVRGKKYVFSVSDFANEFDFCSKESMIKAFSNLNLYLSQYAVDTEMDLKNQIYVSLNSNQKVEDVTTNLDVLSLALKFIEKDEITDNKMFDEVLSHIDYLNLENYPIQRFKMRELYTQFFTRVSGICIANKLRASDFPEIANTVLLSYYGKTSAQMPKKYLDFITAQELKDLAKIYSKTYYAIKEQSLSLSDIMAFIEEEGYNTRMTYEYNYGTKPANAPMHLKNPVSAKVAVYKTNIYDKQLLPNTERNKNQYLLESLSVKYSKNSLSPISNGETKVNQTLLNDETEDKNLFNN